MIGQTASEAGWNEQTEYIARLHNERDDASQAAIAAGFAAFDADCTPAKVIATLAAANEDKKAEIERLRALLRSYANH